MVWFYAGYFAIIALIDLIPLVKRRKWRAVAAFVICFAVGLTLAVLSALDIAIPSVMKAWKTFFEWLGLAYKP